MPTVLLAWKTYSQIFKAALQLVAPLLGSTGNFDRGEPAAMREKLMGNQPLPKTVAVEVTMGVPRVVNTVPGVVVEYVVNT